MRRALQAAAGRAAVAAALATLGAGRAAASDLTVHVGPPAVGNGGSNPVSFPPIDFREYEVVYVTNGGFETSVAITPGLLFGGRSTLGGGGTYVGFGGGYIIDANGQGFGAYSCLGYNTSGTIGFNAELKQAVGFDYGANQLISPYAIRLGVNFHM